MELFKKKNGIVAGCFDLIHPGYIKLFQFCKKNCTTLTIALHKNPQKEREQKHLPFHSLKERKLILSSLKYIDHIITYNTEDDLISIMSKDIYDIRFLDENYKNKKFTGFHLPIKIKWVPRKHNYSTSNLIKNIKNA